MSRFGIAVIACLAFTSVASAEEMEFDEEFYEMFCPSAISMSMRGVEVMDHGSQVGNFLVAGSNVEATITFGGYAPGRHKCGKVKAVAGNVEAGEWFEHTLNGFRIVGYPAAEIEDTFETIVMIMVTS